MTRPIIFILTLCLLFACDDKQKQSVEIPKTVLDRETFTKVLRDFALAEGAANINVKNVTLRQMDSTYAFNPLEENHITQSQYDSAMTFYTKHPTLFKEIYEAVLQQLSEMETKRNSAKKDSTLK